jgi:cytochrome c-type biogenesis protein
MSALITAINTVPLGATSVADSAGAVGIPLAMAAGLVSFLSPCVLPLVPGYVSAIAGVAPADLQHAGARRLLGPSLLFVGGFSLIFILLGLAATRVGATLHEHLGTLRVVGGAVIVAMGIAFMATPFVRFLSFSWHPQRLMTLAGRGSPLLAGIAFAIAWTPCTSVTLGAILTQAAISSSAAHGAVLLACYSLGLAIPFLAIAFAFEHMTRALALMRRHFPVIIAGGGAVLIVLGLLILTGEFTVLNSRANELLQGTGLSSV